MSIYGYIRVSTDQQDLQQQRHLLLEYAQKNQWLIREFVEAEISSRRSTFERRIDELIQKLESGDTLLVAELSRLGRNMLETLNIIDTLTQRGIQIVFIRQPELSTTAPHTKLLLAIYSYFAEAEREYISVRTKQGLAAIKAGGQILGRPKGSKNKNRHELFELKPLIIQYLQQKLSIPTITKLINANRAQPLPTHVVKYFIKQECQAPTPDQ